MSDLETEQEAWVNLAERVRTKLGDRVNEISAMNPEEIGSFVTACQHAYWFHTNCLSFEKTVERELSRNTFQQD